MRRRYVPATVIAVAAIVFGCGRIIENPQQDAADGSAPVGTTDGSIPPVEPRDDAAPPTSPSTLAVRREEAPNWVNLTLDGPRDWVHWGYLGGPANRKNISDPPIGDLVLSTGVTEQDSYNSNRTTFQWDDGTPNSQVTTGNTWHFFAKGPEATATIHVLAAPKKRTAHLYFGVNEGAAELTAKLSNDSVTARSDNVTSATGPAAYVYLVDFQTPTTGAYLILHWKLTNTINENSSIRIAAITLREE